MTGPLFLIPSEIEFDNKSNTVDSVTMISFGFYLKIKALNDHQFIFLKIKNDPFPPVKLVNDLYDYQNDKWYGTLYIGWNWK